MRKEKQEAAKNENLPAVNDSNLPASVLEEMESLEKGEAQAMEITAEYISFDKWQDGEKRAFIFQSMTTFTDKDGQIKPAVNLVDKSGKMHITAASVVATACSKLNGSCPVLICYNGKKKAAVGMYYDVKVYTHPANVSANAPALPNAAQ